VQQRSLIEEAAQIEPACDAEAVEDRCAVKQQQCNVQLQAPMF